MTVISLINCREKYSNHYLGIHRLKAIIGFFSLQTLISEHFFTAPFLNTCLRNTMYFYALIINNQKN